VILHLAANEETLFQEALIDELAKQSPVEPEQKP
jgi:hypothetical protein